MVGSSSELPVTKHPTSLRVDFANGVLKFVKSEVEYTVDGHYTDPKAWNAQHVWLPSFIFSIHDVEDMRKLMSNMTERRTAWRQEIAKQTSSLQEESLTHGDLFFADMVDVYRNIPQKLLRFITWVIQKYKFKYLLKTDDDCYIDVERILSVLRNMTDTQKLWWGRFRNNWLVEHYGKWAEFDYKAMYYPRFACGSGYVLHHSMVHWISQNQPHLKTYQGEDTSMGIWLSAIGPKYHDEPLWQCDRECVSNMYSMPELSPDELRQTWKDKTTCDDPCGCS